MQPLSAHRLLRGPILAALLYLLAVTILAQGCGPAPTIESERAVLQGTWEVVTLEFNGIKSSRELHGVRAAGHVGAHYEFASKELRYISGRLIGPWRRYDLDVVARPKVIYFFPAVDPADPKSAEPSQSAIYRVAGDELQLCFSTFVSRTAPHPARFSSESHNRLLTLKRIPFADPEKEKARLEMAKLVAQAAAYQRLAYPGVRQDQGKYYLDLQDVPFPPDRAQSLWQDILELKNIIDLRLRSCIGVGDAEMQQVQQLVSLKLLDLHSTEVSDAGVARLASLVNLETLDLSFTPTTDRGLGTLVQLPNLKRVTLSGSLVSTAGVEALRGKRPELEVLWTRSYTEPQRKAAAALSRLGVRVDDRIETYLKTKMLVCRLQIPGLVKLPTPPERAPGQQHVIQSGGTGVRTPDAVARLLECLPAGTAVEVLGEGMDDTIFLCLRSVPGLVRLDIARSQVTDAGLAELKRHPTLRVLDLTNARRVSDRGVAELSALTDLEHLKLRGTAVTPVGVAALLKLERLKLLNVSYSQITRELNFELRSRGVRLDVDRDAPVRRREKR